MRRSQLEHDTRPWFKRPLRVIPLAVFALVTLAIMSLITAGAPWDGAFPSGIFHLKVRSQTGEPIAGAVLRVFAGGSRTPALGYPVDNYLADGDLISDEAGLIILHHKYRGLEFGGYAALLFWVIPVGTEMPRFDGELSAEGYQPLQFSVGDFFGDAYGKGGIVPETTIVVDGRERDIGTYEHGFTLVK